MRLLYLDCFAGCSGDMFLGALLDLGVPEQAVRDELAKLNLTGYSVSTRRVVKQNIAATKFDCFTAAADEHDHRGYREITGLIGTSALAEPVKRRALNVFRRIGEAEARIHNVPLEQIHFHEVGAVDSIVDIIGVCAAVHGLNVDEVRALPPPLGSGFVETAHGRFPVPAPATLELLKGIPTQPTGLAVELVTPTGAALLAEFCSQFGPLPAMSVEKIGYGAGSRDLDKTPNVLRAILGQTTGTDTDVVHILETNLDDMNPQLFGDVMERLLAAGALDVWLTPAQMKKNRPGTVLAALCDPRHTDALAELLLTHTTSFGLRITTAQRRKLAREIIRVATRYGEIEVKVGRLAGRIVAWSPEYESCKRAAAAHGVPVKDVQEAALRKRHD